MDIFEHRGAAAHQGNVSEEEQARFFREYLIDARSPTMLFVDFLAAEASAPRPGKTQRYRVKSLGGGSTLVTVERLPRRLGSAMDAYLCKKAPDLESLFLRSTWR